MLQIGDKVVSLELLEEKFICDLEKCQGQCCVDGESGAPLENGEKELIEKFYPLFKNYLRKDSVESIENQGFAVTDRDGDLVTPLLNGEECVYTIFENDIAKCAIEKAFFDNKITFRKPISCHLYPVRLKNLYDNIEAVNYHKWSVCQPARELGCKKNMIVYKFLKDALIRKFGIDWYNELDEVASLYLKEKANK
ncbi:MAG: hypothetical protein A2W99_17730 [Bacteroidetes bacterium GWF2_33_16]|nr:MAG: hypothetical protein A2X00_14870 [Bacteroidetes bacterium GWE2_32_14]OFY06877.1 MAG: hypothetical protein A2W99_17730 [Bacteroidetes bacterium GWF2_33_16]